MKKFISIVCVIFVLFSTMLIGCKKCEHEFVWKVFSEGSCTEKKVEEGLCLKCGEKGVRTGDFVHQYDVDKICVVCGAQKPIELSQDILDALITEEGILSSYSLQSIKNDWLTKVWIDNASNLNLGIVYGQYGQFSLGVKYPIKLVDYNLADGEEKEIYAFKVSETDGIFCVYYTDGEYVEFGCKDDIRGVFVNLEKEVFIAYKYKSEKKIGILKSDEPMATTDLLFKSVEGGYSVAGYIGESKSHIVIPSTFNGKNVVEISPYAFKDEKNIKSVVFGDNIKAIGNWAFWHCSNLTEVTFSSSIETIRSGAFYESALKTISYKGTREQKERIDINKQFNDNLFINVAWKYI